MIFYNVFLKKKQFKSITKCKYNNTKDLKPKGPEIYKNHQISNKDISKLIKQLKLKACEILETG